MKLAAVGLMMLLNTHNVLADESHEAAFIKVGGSLNESSLLIDKLVSIGYDNRLIWVFDYRLELGAFTINQSTHVTAFGSPSLGLAIVEPKYYFKLFVGPLLLSQIDDHLGTPFEINNDLEIGLKDERGVGIGIGYKHISNAGTGGPNLGRDFIYFKVMIP